MQRRQFIQNTTLTALGITAFGGIKAFNKTAAAGNTLKVNGKRIESRIFELAKFGMDANGRGTRVAYTQADIEGRAWFIDLMKRAGLNPTIDTAGNIIGRRKGINNSLKPIAFGSHIDMVPDGGNYDGTLGSIGSKALVGDITKEGLQQRSQSGLTMVEGFANHAGATQMNMRQDALLAASKLVITVNEVITSVKGTQVGTVGKIAVLPGAYNVIPGKVQMGLEIRDLSAEKIEMLFKEIEKRAALIAKASKTKIRFERQANESLPALTDKKLQQMINTTAKSLGFSTKFMQSGAGHDTQHIGAIAPAAMIFIPSVGGISHSAKEFSTPLDMENGANVLLQTLLSIDKAV